MNKIEHLSRIPCNSVYKACVIFLPSKINMGLWSKKEWPIPEIFKGCYEPLHFACSQHTINPSLAQSVSSPADAFKQFFFIRMMTQVWYGTKFHVAPLPCLSPRASHLGHPLLHFWQHPLLHFWQGFKEVFTGSEQFVHSLLQKGPWAWGLNSPWVGSLCKKPPEGATPSELPFQQTYLGLLEQLGVSSLEDKCCLSSAIFN